MWRAAKIPWDSRQYLGIARPTPHYSPIPTVDDVFREERRFTGINLPSRLIRHLWCLERRVAAVRRCGTASPLCQYAWSFVLVVRGRQRPRVRRTLWLARSCYAAILLALMTQGTGPNHGPSSLEIVADGLTITKASAAVDPTATGAVLASAGGVVNRINRGAKNDALVVGPSKQEIEIAALMFETPKVAPGVMQTAFALPKAAKAIAAVASISKDVMPQGRPGRGRAERTAEAARLRIARRRSPTKNPSRPCSAPAMASSSTRTSTTPTPG